MAGLDDIERKVADIAKGQDPSPDYTNYLVPPGFGFPAGPGDLGESPGPTAPPYNPPADTTPQPGAGPSFPDVRAPSPFTPSILVGGVGGGGPRTTPRRATARTRSVRSVQYVGGGAYRVEYADGTAQTKSAADLSTAERTKLKTKLPVPRKPDVVLPKSPRRIPWGKVGGIATAAVLIGEQLYDVYQDRQKAAEEQAKEAARAKKAKDDYYKRLSREVMRDARAMARQMKRDRQVMEQAAKPPNVNVTVNVPGPAQEPRSRAPTLPKISVPKPEIPVVIPAIPETKTQKVARVARKAARSLDLQTILAGLGAFAQFRSSGRSVRTQLSSGIVPRDPLSPNPLSPTLNNFFPVPIPGGSGGRQGGSGSNNCRCTKTRKKPRNSCRNPVVSKRSRTVDGRLLQTVTREITCPPSRPKSA